MLDFFVIHIFCISFQDAGFLGVLVRSIYEIHLAEWLQVFPREQFLFIQLEDYFRDRVSYIRKVVDFLKLSKCTLGKSLPAPLPAVSATVASTYAAVAIIFLQLLLLL